MTTHLETLRAGISLREINFPVFKLTNKKPETEAGVVFYSNTYLDVDSNVKTTHVKIIDDLNQPAKTLGLRRLALKANDVDLYPLKIAVYYLGDFIKLAKPNQWFVDYTGRCFTYKKTSRAKLRFLKIEQVVRDTKTTGSVIEIEGYPERFKTLFVIPENHRYAGVLSFSGVSVLYGTYEQKHKDTWRMV